MGASSFCVSYCVALSYQFCITLTCLQTFVVLFTRRDSQAAGEFVRTLERVGGPMGIRLGQPQM